jgi:hypothetical protein
MANGAFNFKDSNGNIVSFISGSGSDIIMSGGTLNLSSMTGLTLGNLTMEGTVETASFAPNYLLTSSFESYTGTTDTVIGTLQTSTSSLNSFTSSTTSRLNSIEGVSGSYATTGSNQFKNDQVITGSLTVTGFIDAQELRTTYISSSILYRSGSTKFGDELSDTHAFTGSLLVDGQVSVSPNTNSSYISSTIDVIKMGRTTSGRPSLFLDTSDTTYTNRVWFLENYGPSGSLIIGRNGLDAVKINNSGDFGIGSVPSYKLDVNSGTTNVVARFESTDGTAAIMLKDNNGNVELSATGNSFSVQPGGGTTTFTVGSDGSSTFTNTDDARVYIRDTTDNSTLVLRADLINEIYTDSANDLQIYTNGNQNGQIYLKQSTGKVGVGSTNPDEKLHVNGNIAAINSSYPTFKVQGSDVNYQGRMRWDTNNNVLEFLTRHAGTYYSDTLVLKEGNVGMGTNNPTTLLDIVGSNSAELGALRIYNSAGSPGSQNSVSLLMQVRNSINNLPSVKLIAQESTNDSNLGELIVQTSNDNSATLSEVVRIAQSGAGGARFIRMASGTGGIQFNGDTAAANALDDYEEGTWTPTFQSLSLNVSANYSDRLGTYTKIGNMVYVFFDMTATSISGTLSGAIITGLPYTVSNSLAGYSVGQYRDASGIEAAPDNTVLKGFAERGQSYIYLQFDNTGTAGFATNSSSVGWKSTGGRITGYVIYQA